MWMDESNPWDDPTAQNTGPAQNNDLSWDENASAAEQPFAPPSNASPSWGNNFSAYTAPQEESRGAPQAPAQGGAWWDSPQFISGGFDTDFSNFGTGNAPAMQMSQGAGLSPQSWSPSVSAGLPTAFTAGTGVGINTPMTFGTNSSFAPPAAGNASLTGDMGGTIEKGLNGVESWGKSHPLLSAALAQIASRVANNRAQQQAQNQYNQGQSDRAEGLGYLREQRAAQQEATNKNNQVAGQWNENAAQYARDANSNFNPQNRAVRSMAQQQAANSRARAAAKESGRKKGLSAEAIAANDRRAGLDLGGTTAYMEGLDNGRAMQGQALTTAKGLGMPYGFADSSNAQSTLMAGARGALPAKDDSLQKLLEMYLGNPTQREVTKQSKTQ